jgi:hypothetical protein
LGALFYVAILLAPIYAHNYRLQQYIEEITQRADNDRRSDDVLRTAVSEKAASLALPVKVEDVLINRSAQGVRIDVRYMVRVELPVYSVDLHFYPGAGAR